MKEKNRNLFQGEERMIEKEILDPWSGEVAALDAGQDGDSEKSRGAHRILVADPLDPAGLELLRTSGAEVVEVGDGGGLEELVATCDALVVRSRTRVDDRLLGAAPCLRVVARAGIGIDNIDLDAATRRGILVINAPTANLLSATEHTFALLLALARRIPAADTALKAGRWDRRRFVGIELQGKTLGIVGLGRIGQGVAARARGFDMAVIAHDPFLPPETGRRLDIELLELDDLLERSDVVTLHIPLTDDTRGLLDGARLARMKPGALLVNCARGGVIDEAALVGALESGHLGGAALDVFAEEPPRDRALVEHPRVVATPHLGAQTREAQERASTQTARMVLAALEGSLAVPAVNLPFRWCSGTRGEPYLRLAGSLGSLAASLLGGGLRRIEVSLRGIGEELHRPLAAAAVRGALVPSLGASVSYVNVDRVASERGIEVVRSARNEIADYPELVTVRVVGGEGAIDLAGTLFRNQQPRVVRLGGLPLEFRPGGRLLVLRTWDLPGVVGRVGTLLGEADVNIADVHLARKDGEEDAWTVLRLDETPAPEVLERLAQLSEVRTVRMIDLA